MGAPKYQEFSAGAHSAGASGRRRSVQGDRGSYRRRGRPGAAAEPPIRLYLDVHAGRRRAASSMPMPPRHSAFAYVYEGEVAVGCRRDRQGELLVFGAGDAVRGDAARSAGAIDPGRGAPDRRARGALWPVRDEYPGRDHAGGPGLPGRPVLTDSGVDSQKKKPASGGFFRCISRPRAGLPGACGRAGAARPSRPIGRGPRSLNGRSPCGRRPAADRRGRGRFGPRGWYGLSPCGRGPRASPGGLGPRASRGCRPGDADRARPCGPRGPCGAPGRGPRSP